MFNRINQTSQGIYIKVSQFITDIYELGETEQTAIFLGKYQRQPSEKYNQIATRIINRLYKICRI